MRVQSEAGLLRKKLIQSLEKRPPDGYIKRSSSCGYRPAAGSTDRDFDHNGTVSLGGRIHYYEEWNNMFQKSSRWPGGKGEWDGWDQHSQRGFERLVNTCFGGRHHAALLKEEFDVPGPGFGGIRILPLRSDQSNRFVLCKGRRFPPILNDRTCLLEKRWVRPNHLG